MKKIILTFLIFSIFQISTSQNTILWKVTDTVNNKESVILGTYHQLGNSFIDSIPEIKKFMNEADLAIFESVDGKEKVHQAINSREESRLITKKLRKKDLRTLQKLSKNWEINIYKLRPIELRIKLTQEFLKHKCKLVKETDNWDLLDSYLKYLAQEQNIEVVGLETGEQQLEHLESEYEKGSWKKEKKSIRYWLNQLTDETPELYACEFANKYTSFNLEYEFNKQCPDDILIKRRNEEWMEKLPNLLSENNSFVAVGFLHLAYKCGLLEQLRNNGFLVEPIDLRPRT